MFLINSLGSVDITFFIIAAVVLGALVGLYFLIPLLNAKQNKAQRENLKKREIEFNAKLESNKKLREAKIQNELEQQKQEPVKEVKEKDE